MAFARYKPGAHINNTGIIKRALDICSLAIFFKMLVCRETSFPWPKKKCSDQISKKKQLWNNFQDCGNNVRYFISCRENSFCERTAFHENEQMALMVGKNTGLEKRTSPCNVQEALHFLKKTKERRMKTKQNNTN